MSDLSRLLEDVYRSDAPAASPGQDAPSAPGPSWSSDAALDEVFADWVPGPPADAPEAERAYAEASAVYEAPEPSEADDDRFAPLQALLEEAMRLAPDIEEPDEPGQLAPHDEMAEAFLDVAQVSAPFPDLDQVSISVPEIDLEVTTGHTGLQEPAPTPLCDPAVDAVLDPEVHVEPEELAFTAPVPVRGWRLSDDDVLPRGRARRGLRLRR